MIKTGLTSVTFRNLSIQEIIDIALLTDVKNIEWGGDIHVQNERQAEIVAKMCKKNSINCSSYGSYYRLGTYGDDYPENFNRVLATAHSLQSETIRIWAYEKSSDQVSSDSDEYNRIVHELTDIARIAENKGISLSFEHHQNTLTDDASRAIGLINDSKSDNVHMYWQIQVPLTFEENIRDLISFRSYLKNIHISNEIGRGKYLPLVEIYGTMKNYLDCVKDLNVIALIEFVAGNTVESYKEDVTILKRMIEEIYK